MSTIMIMMMRTTLLCRSVMRSEWNLNFWDIPWGDALWLLSSRWRRWWSCSVQITLNFSLLGNFSSYIPFPFLLMDNFEMGWFENDVKSETLSISASFAFSMAIRRRIFLNCFNLRDILLFFRCSCLTVVKVSCLFSTITLLQNCSHEMSKQKWKLIKFSLCLTSKK